MLLKKLKHLFGKRINGRDGTFAECISDCRKLLLRRTIREIEFTPAKDANNQTVGLGSIQLKLDDGVTFIVYLHEVGGTALELVAYPPKAG